MSFCTGIWGCWAVMSRCIQELKNLALCKDRKTANIWGCEVCYSIFPHWCQSYNSQIVDPFSSSTTLASNVILYCMSFADLCTFFFFLGLQSLITWPKVKITHMRKVWSTICHGCAKVRRFSSSSLKPQGIFRKKVSQKYTFFYS